MMTHAFATIIAKWWLMPPPLITDVKASRLCENALKLCLLHIPSAWFFGPSKTLGVWIFWSLKISGKFIKR